jgi:hypothetical protein
MEAHGHEADRHPDVSLRASSETYLNRQKESDLILERLHRSTSSVIGIAGVRGAGKSSLALKVLDHCDAKGYFTLLIPSPIAYDAQEFLIALYQRVCEAAVSRLQRTLGEVVSLEEMGRTEILRLRRRFRGIIAAGLVLIVVSFGYSAFESQKYSAARKSAEVTNIINKLKGEADRAQAMVAETEEEAKVAKVAKDDAALKEATDRAARAKEFARSIDDELEYFMRRTRESAAAVVYGTTIPVFLASALVLTIVYLMWIAARRARARYHRLRAHPLHAGLYQQAQRNLEYLRYQATLKTSSEAGGTVYGLAAKFTRAKDLAVRPMSLPGITAECNVFLSQVADVMGGKVVVCLDELDKITDPEQLQSLLRGVKGLFGQRRHYFLLTVSEDALAAFAARRHGDRNILESSFEEILYLDRVPLSLATQIISQMTGAAEKGDERRFFDNCVLMWVFGLGIPREIKRNVLICESAGRKLDTNDPLDVWRALYLALIDSLRHWALLAVHGEGRSYVALRYLDDIQNHLQALPSDAGGLSKCIKGIATSSLAYVGTSNDHDGHVDITRKSGDNADADSPIRRIALELEIGLLALLAVTTPAESREGILFRLMEIFPIVGLSPRFAALKAQAMLRELGVVENVEM